MRESGGPALHQVGGDVGETGLGFSSVFKLKAVFLALAGTLLYIQGQGGGDHLGAAVREGSCHGVTSHLHPPGPVGHLYLNLCLIFSFL